MAKVINSGSTVKVTKKGHPRDGQAGRCIGGSDFPDHENVLVKFDADQVEEDTSTDILTVLGS